ncbi:MAG: hypothetical protein O2843_08865, partial [Chloroflexi bacterium]|nr:hypothetical protein [Chloroflexota bacterium]
GRNTNSPGGMNTGGRSVWMVVVFDSKESYRANAERLNMDAIYRRIRGCLDRDPEWSDGSVMAAYGLGKPRE